MLNLVCLFAKNSVQSAPLARLMSNGFHGAFLLLCNEWCLSRIGTAWIRVDFGGRQTGHCQLVLMLRRRHRHRFGNYTQWRVWTRCRTRWTSWGWTRITRLTKILQRNFLGTATISKFTFPFILFRIWHECALESYRGRGVRGLDSLERIFVLPLARFLDVSLDLVPPLLLQERSLGVEKSENIRALIFWIAGIACTHPSIERLCAIWTRLTLPDGILSRRRAAANPGTRFAVENKGRCSRGCFADDDVAAALLRILFAACNMDGDASSFNCCPLISSSCAICVIFFWRAFVRPLVSRCLAAMHRMWSSKMNFADKIVELLVAAPPRWIVMCKHRESSLSPVTSTSCKNPTSFAMPHPKRFESGSTSINCSNSITRKRRYFVPSFESTVQAIRSLLSKWDTDGRLRCWKSISICISENTYSNPAHCPLGSNWFGWTVAAGSPPRIQPFGTICARKNIHESLVLLSPLRHMANDAWNQCQSMVCRSAEVEWSNPCTGIPHSMSICTIYCIRLRIDREICLRIYRNCARQSCFGHVPPKSHCAAFLLDYTHGYRLRPIDKKV